MSFVFQLLPMSVLHIIASQTFDQVQNNSHVSYFLSQSLPSFDEPNFLVDLLDLSSKNFILINQYISFDLSPEFSFPIIVLKVDNSNQIPKGLKIFQVRKTFLQRLVISSLQLKSHDKTCLI